MKGSENSSPKSREYSETTLRSSGDPNAAFVEDRRQCRDRGVVVDHQGRGLWPGVEDLVHRPTDRRALGLAVVSVDPNVVAGGPFDGRVPEPPHIGAAAFDDVVRRGDQDDLAVAPFVQVVDQDPGGLGEVEVDGVHLASVPRQPDQYAGLVHFAQRGDPRVIGG